MAGEEQTGEVAVARWSQLLKRAFGVRGPARLRVDRTVSPVFSIFSKAPIEYDDGEVMWWAGSDSFTAPAGRFPSLTIQSPVAGRLVLDSIRLSASVAGNASVVKNIGVPNALANSTAVQVSSYNSPCAGTIYDVGILRGDLGAVVTACSIGATLPNTAMVELLTDPVTLDGKATDFLLVRWGGVASLVTLSLRGRLYSKWPE